MSGYDDYRGEMQGTAISDQEIERFFAGEASNGLATLSPLVEMLRDFDSPPSDAAVDRFAAKASRLALGSMTAQPTIPVHRRRALRLRPQLAGATLALVMLIGGAGVAAAAADGSAPRDALYGLDRALERIGIWDGRIEERLDEASTLFAEGQARLALEHATEALAENGEGSVLALASLEDALDELPGPEDPEVATGTTEKVGALLTYLQENVGKGVGADGREFGQGVAELARGLTGEDEESAPATTLPLPAAPGNSGDNGDAGTGNGNGATPPGQGNQGTNPGQGNQGTNPGQGNQGTNPGQGNQGTNPGQGNGNQGTNPGQGNGNQGTNPESGSGEETGEPAEDGDPDPPGQGNGNQGTGPPSSSPSETAPGRANKP